MRFKLRKVRSPLILLFSLAFLLAQAAASTPYVLVSVEPASIEVHPGDEFNLAVKVDPGSYGVSGGEVELTFDPKQFSVIKVDVGNLFGPEPLVGFKEVNDTVGRIRFAIARKGETIPPTPPGNFLVIRFKVKENAGFESYTIKIAKIGLCNEKFEDIPEIDSRNAEISVGQHSTLASFTLPTTVTIMTILVVGFAICVIVTILLKRAK